jgi:hypothetical protein
MADLTMFGYPVHVTVELPGGPHDISHLVELVSDPAGWRVDGHRLLSEIDIEQRARTRAGADQAVLREEIAGA